MKKILLNTPYIEDEKTLILFEEIKGVKNQGYLTRDQLLKILVWKSPRPLRHYKSNDDKLIKEITSIALATQNDILKLHILTALSGVSYPAASAILMFYNPAIYPVLDIRVWTQLYKAQLVKSNPNGQNFTLKECELYFDVIRKLGIELNLTARQVEKRIFDYDIENQKGTLYKKQI